MTRRAARMALALAALAVTVPSGFTYPALAHPGGLNAEGCHNNRKTGDYHCHGAKPAPRAAPSGTYFANCAEARAARAAPLRRGQPGYRPALDRDNDGVACE